MTGLWTTTAVELVLATGALVATLALGTAAHEFAHAVVLRSFGVPVEVTWFPDRAGSLGAGAVLSSRWATATPLSIPPTLPPWALRLAALAPFALATPMALVLLGVLPDPTLVGNPALVAATLAWFACALPSPQDFSLFWYAESVIAGDVDGAIADERSA